MVGAVEDLRYSFLLVVGKVPQKLGPAVFTKDPIKVWVVSVDFDNNHIAGLVDVINITNDHIHERCGRQGRTMHNRITN